MVPTFQKETANSILRPMSNRSVVDQIVERVTDAIISGELKAGDKIPTELELSDSIGVGRNSVREAIKILVSQGVLQIRRAEGTFVCDSFNDHMLDPLIYSLILEKDASKHIVALRRVFETGILDTVIRRVTPAQIRQLEQAFHNLEQQVIRDGVDADKVLDADIAFHRVLVQITDNDLIDKVSSMIERLTAPSRRRTIGQILATDNGRRLIELHAELLDVVKTRHADRISDAMEHHFSFWIPDVSSS
ncbi:MAG: FadR family transcriptional regulator [Clostridiaceae bacterium]|jgi:DNA-binding FadR family transcriptional regulator|nr:FadR family transcriptional regulator [Clostridiaceae bacterium]